MEKSKVAPNRLDLKKEVIDLLIDAYADNSLSHNHCDHCAVGNIVASKSLVLLNDWYNYFSTAPVRIPIKKFNTAEILKPTIMDHRSNRGNNRDGFSTKCSIVIGYSADELEQIELAFETSIATIQPEDKSDFIHWATNTIEDYNRTPYDYYLECDRVKGQYIGLCAVLDVLDEIHGVEEPSTKDKERLHDTYKQKATATI